MYVTAIQGRPQIRLAALIFVQSGRSHQMENQLDKANVPSREAEPVLSWKPYQTAVNPTAKPDKVV